VILVLAAALAEGGHNGVTGGNMRTLELVALFAMPLSIFLLLGSKLVTRLRLEQRGHLAQANVTSVRTWTDSLDGIKHQIVRYQLVLGDDDYCSSTDVPVRGRGYAAGDHISVIYLPSRPDKPQPVTGGPATSVGLTACVMLAMVVLMLWMVSLLNLHA
jgi:uncharacterized protein DUF3592